MTKQEIFDKACAGVIAQGKPSGYPKSNGGFTCQYRGPDGCKCAIGHIIPDEMYDPDIESSAIVGLLTMNYAPVKFRDEFKELLGDLLGEGDLLREGDSYDFLRALQVCHDQAAQQAYHYGPRDLGESFINHFKIDATLLADRFSLNTDVLNV